MTHAAHPATLQPAPDCPGCGQPMHPTPAGHHTCTCDGTTPATYDLPRGHDQRPVRARERRIRTTTAIDVWDDYQPEQDKAPTNPGLSRRRR